MVKLAKQIGALMKVTFFLLGVLVVTAVSAFILIFNTDRKFKSIGAENWKPKSIAINLPEGELGETINYGYQLITETSKYIGPLAESAANRFAGNNLSCSNCHLNAGRKIGAVSFIGVTNRFPQYRGRENKIGTIEERINGCLERSMDGSKMPEQGKEIQAIVAYMEWLSEEVPDNIEKLYKGLVDIELPNVKADSAIGRLLYAEKCMQCHGKEGMGEPNEGKALTGYTYPPLAGNDSFNDGAGMNRVITAAQFIKSNMPFGATYDAPQVTDEEAYHIAAYITSFQRPAKPDKEMDFPDLKRKPLSTAYGPWADSFTDVQHKYGPFQPIQEFYKEQFGIDKNK